MDDLNAKNDELTQLSEESGIKLSQYQQEQQEAIQGLDNNSAELQQLNSDIEAYYDEALRQEYENQQQSQQPSEAGRSFRRRGSTDTPSGGDGGSSGGGDTPAPAPEP